MKKRITALIMLVMIASLVLSFSGCASQVLYGKWKLMQTGDPDTGEFTDYDFMFPIVVDVKKDGTINMLDSLFGTYEKDGHEFKFWYDQDGEKGEQVTGGWELHGTDLYIYPDNNPVIYKLSRVTDATPTPVPQQ